MKATALFMVLAIAIVCTKALSEEKTAPEIKILEVLYEAKVAEQVTGPHDEAMKDLKVKYSAALVRSQEAAQNDGKLEDAIAFKNENKMIDDGGEVPATNEGAIPESLKNFRATYRKSGAKLEQDRKSRLQVLATAQAKELTELSIKLTKAGQLDEAQTAKQKAEALTADAQPAQPKPQPPAPARAADTRANDSFARQITGTEWKWNAGSNVLTLGKNGNVQMQDWDRKGLVTVWKVTEPGHVELTIASGRTNNLTATLIFTANRKSFKGTDFDGKPLNESPQLK